MKRKTKGIDSGVTGPRDLARPSHSRTRRSRTASAPVDDKEKQVRPSAKRKGKEKQGAEMVDSGSRTPTDGAARQRPKPKPRSMVPTVESEDTQMDISSEPVSDGTTQVKQAPRYGEAESNPSSSHGCSDTTAVDPPTVVAATTREVSSRSGQLENDGGQHSHDEKGQHHSVASTIFSKERRSRKCNTDIYDGGSHVIALQPSSRGRRPGYTNQIDPRRSTRSIIPSPATETGKPRDGIDKGVSPHVIKSIDISFRAKAYVGA